jgi:hypothetical protein
MYEELELDPVAQTGLALWTSFRDLVGNVHNGTTLVPLAQAAAVLGGVLMDEPLPGLYRALVPDGMPAYRCTTYKRVGAQKAIGDLLVKMGTGGTAIADVEFVRGKIGGALNGLGPWPMIVHLEDGSGNPITTGSVRISGQQYAFNNVDGSGNAQINLQSGAVTINASAATGYQAIAPTLDTIDANGNWASSGTPTRNVVLPVLNIPAPPADNQVNCYLYTRDLEGNIKANATVSFAMTALPPGESGNAFDAAAKPIVSDVNGLIIVPLKIGATYDYWAGSGAANSVTIPISGPLQLKDVRGAFA